MYAVSQTCYQRSFSILLNLLSWFSGFNSKDSTHVQGHILDLVLSHGFAVSDIEISDFLLSDHKPILFSMSLPNLSHFTKKSVTLSRSYSSKFGSNFNQCFMESCSHLSLDLPLPDLDADQHLSLLNSAWLDVLDTVMGITAL